MEAVSFGGGGFAHRPCIEKVIGGVDEPHDDTEENVALREDVNMEDTSEERGGDYCAECHVEAKKVEGAIVMHGAKVLLTQRCRKWFGCRLPRNFFSLMSLLRMRYNLIFSRSSKVIGSTPESIMDCLSFSDCCH